MISVLQLSSNCQLESPSVLDPSIHHLSFPCHTRPQKRHGFTPRQRLAAASSPAPSSRSLGHSPSWRRPIPARAVRVPPPPTFHVCRDRMWHASLHVRSSAPSAAPAVSVGFLLALGFVVGAGRRGDGAEDEEGMAEGNGAVRKSVDSGGLAGHQGKVRLNLRALSGGEGVVDERRGREREYLGECIHSECLLCVG